MFAKKYTEEEMKRRLDGFWKELSDQCHALGESEFEYYYEVWGMWWMPWYIEVNKQALNFTANDITANDLDALVKKDLIEPVKIYPQSEMKDEFGRVRYRIKI